MLDNTIDIVVTPQKLSDGSIVWDVHFMGLILGGEDRDAAEEIADMLEAAVDKSTSHSSFRTTEDWKI